MTKSRKAVTMAAFASATAMLAVTSSDAHVVVAPESGLTGQFLVLSFWVPEGCAGSSTRAVRVEIPSSIRMAKPQPKNGWTLEIGKQPIAQPIKTESGPITERVSTITWSGGSVTDEQFEQFAVLVRLPAQAGPVFFPVVQTCEKGEAKWTEVPATPATTHELAYPAPVLKVTAGGKSHAH